MKTRSKSLYKSTTNSPLKPTNKHDPKLKLQCKVIVTKLNSQTLTHDCSNTIYLNYQDQKKIFLWQIGLTEKT